VKPMRPQELEAKLRDALLHGGKCTKGQVQAWALNRLSGDDPGEGREPNRALPLTRARRPEWRSGRFPRRSRILFSMACFSSVGRVLPK
jgi:hypothetical protein